MLVGLFKMLLDLVVWIPCVFILFWVLKNYDLETSLGPAVAIMACSSIYAKWERWIKDCYQEHKESDG